jgi:HK97 family phage portal protein
MGFFDRFRRTESRAFDSHDLLTALLQGSNSKAGVHVTPETAIASAAVAAALGLRATAFSTLPVHLYRNSPDGREKASLHPAYRLLRDAPNESMTASKFWRWKQLTQDLYGNAYALIERDRSGQVRAIRPLLGSVTPIIEFKSGTPVVKGYAQEFHFNEGAVKQTFPRGDVMHFPSEFIGADGVTGRSIVEVCREAIGLDIGSEEFFARVLANGTHMGTVLIANDQMTDTQFEQLREQLADGRGVTPAGKIRMFRNAEPKVLGMSIKDAELIEQRRFQIERICNVTRIPVGMMDPSHLTYSNSEQADITLGKHCIRPICVDTEQVLNVSVLRSDPTLYAKFDLNGLMRGDFKSRMEGYATGVNGGFIKPNEPREWEELHPAEGGDELRFPLNSVPAPEAGQAQRALSVMHTDALSRIRSRRVSDAERGRDTTEFARRALSVVRAAYEAAGLTFDEDAALKEALA